MRALSVRQPWAELIAIGKKKIEFRSWSLNFRGDLLIVASASRHDEDCADVRLDADRLVYGAAVCLAELWKVTGTEGDYRWHLRDPRRVVPVPVKGYASIYNVDDRLIRPTKLVVAQKSASARSGGTKKRASAPSGGARKRASVPSRERRAPPMQIPRLRPDAARVVVAARDATAGRRWGQALRGLGIRVTPFSDGFASWCHLAENAAACVLLDGDIDGRRASDVVTCMRESEMHARTPVVVVGGSRSEPRGDTLRRLPRGASTDQVARAVQALVADELA